jgi:hypothetical protein
MNDLVCDGGHVCGMRATRDTLGRTTVTPAGIEAETLEAACNHHCGTEGSRGCDVRVRWGRARRRPCLGEGLLAENGQKHTRHPRHTLC